METVKKANNYVHVPLELLDLHESNPREDLGDIKGLAASIIGAGRVITALSGFKKDGRYKIVDGSRRFAALKYLEKNNTGYEALIAIPFEVLPASIDGTEIVFKQLLSNDGEPLKPLEIADGVSTLFLAGLKAKDIAERLGKSSVYVNELRRMAELPNDIKKLIKNGTISATLVRQQMKNGTLEAFIENINEIQSEVGGEDVESEEISRQPIVKVTNKDIPGINSMKEFKRFMKAFTEIFPDKEIQARYELLVRIVDNELDYDYFLNYFTNANTVDKAIKSDVKPAVKAPKEKAEKRGRKVLYDKDTDKLN